MDGERQNSTAPPPTQEKNQRTYSVELPAHLYFRVKKIANRQCISIHRLVELWVEATVTWHEIDAAAETETVNMLQDVLTRLISEQAQ